MQTINLNAVAPLLETNVSISRKDFLTKVRAYLHPSDRLLQLISMLPYFQVSKDNSGRVILQ